MKNKYIIYIVTGLMLLVSCAPEKIPDEDYIDFKEVLVPVDTKAGGVGVSKMDTEGEFQSKSFGVFGYRSANGIDFSTMVFDYDEAKEVRWDATTSAWTYTPKAKWIRSNYYRFRAFWPYDECVPTGFLSPTSNANMLAIKYSTLADYYDLMVAYSERYPINDGIGTVEMSFNHALAGVCFKVKFADASAQEDYLTEFYLKSLYPTGTLLYGLDGSHDDAAEDATDINWYIADVTFDTESKLYHWVDDGTKDRTFTSSKEASVFDNDGLIYVIPQTVTSATTLNFKTNSGGSALHTAALTDGTIRWEPGKIYTYTVIIKGAKITLTVDIADWTVVDSNIDVNL